MDDELEPLLRSQEGSAVERLVGGKVAEFGGLLSRRAAIRLLCKERGISQERKIQLSGARAAQSPFSFVAKINRIFPLQKFPSSPDRSIRLFASDQSGSATVVLWNEQADLLFGEVSLFDTVEFFGAHFRSGEIFIGRQGGMRAVQKFPHTPLSSLKEGPLTTKGSVSLLEPILPPGRGQGTRFRSAFSFWIEGEGGSARVVAWEGDGAAFDRLSQGDIVLLENAYCRQGELHLSSVSRLVVSGSLHDRQGSLDCISLDGANLVVVIGGEILSAPLGDGLSMLGINFLPDGIEPKVAVPIMSSGFCGKKVVYSSKGGQLLRLRFA